MKRYHRQINEVMLCMNTIHVPAFRITESRNDLDPPFTKAEEMGAPLAETYDTPSSSREAAFEKEVIVNGGDLPLYQYNMSLLV